ncbi:MAG: L,D-transpeptidase [Opitutaceae bacterium]|nr:L,D-transpeptidase [Opitutaceae bacterium]
MLERLEERCATLGIKPSARVIAVSIARQTLMFFQDRALRRSHVISTSLRPPSNVKDSLGTPRGLHVIAEKHGAGSPPGIVFNTRVSTGRHFSEFDPAAQARNLITSRILWLRGLEPGVNAGRNAAGEVVDTYERYVYIHGTNHEERLGAPFSGGCIEMNNLEIVALFEELRVGDLVSID